LISVRSFGKKIGQHLPANFERSARYIFDSMPETFRFGRNVSDWDTLLAKSENWDRRTLIAYQKEKIEELLDWAEKHIPYYRDIARTDDTQSGLKHFPILEKETVRKYRILLSPDDISIGPYEEDKTSGSTGIPLTFLLSKQIIAKERAFWKRLLRWGGFHPKKDRILTIRGGLGNDRSGREINTRYVPADNHLLISTIGLNKSSIPCYIEQVNNFKPQVISGFPSVLLLISQYVRANKQYIFSPKFIHTSSETLFPEVRAEIAEAFQCKILNWYGLNERCATAQECPEFNNMHINMEYGLLEIHGTPLEDAPNKGYLIGSGFDNLAMPLIRYNTLDIGRISDEFCPCGRQSLLLKDLEGRIDDFIITEDGRFLPPAYFGIMMKRFKKVNQFQVLQEENASITIFVIGPNLTSDDLKTMQQIFKSNLNSSAVCFKITSDLQRTAHGKIRRIISKVSSS